jgi:UDP-glucose 4-epimerase
MKVVVLGASGNAGTALLRALEAEPAVDEVVAAARRPPERWPSAKTVWRALDVVADPLEPVLAGADVVVHLAWLIQPSRDRAQTHAVNVDGSHRVMQAVAAAGVPALVYASSVGAYSRGPKDRQVDETWPTGGVPSSFYSRDKAEVERLLDAFEREQPDVRVVRLRPGLIFQRGAASEIRRLFAGPFLPSRLVDPKWIPIVPRHPRLRFQAVHADDVADAYRRAIVGDARGAFNIAAEPVLDGEALGRLLNARAVPVPAPVLRSAAAGAFHLRLTPTPPGWVDMALAVPLMDTTRAGEVLGWQATRDAGDTLLELLDGMRTEAGAPTPTLAPGGDGRLRSREILSGVGARGPR